MTGSKKEYYRIKSGALTGYVKASDTQLVMAGKAYAVALPAKFTNQSTLYYQITATDIYGNKSSSDLIKVRLLTEDEIAAMLGKKSGKKRTPARATVQKQKEEEDKGGFPWLIATAGLLLVGGGIYYYLSQQDDDDEMATVDVQVEWK